MDERAVVAAERDLMFAAWTADHESGRLPLDARRGMLPHERNAGTDFAMIAADTHAAHQALHMGMLNDMQAMIEEVERRTESLVEPAYWMLKQQQLGIGAMTPIITPAVERNYRILDDVAAAGWLSVGPEIARAPTINLKGPIDIFDFDVMERALNLQSTEIIAAAFQAVMGPLTFVLDKMIQAALSHAPWAEIARALTLKGPSIDYGRVAAVRTHRASRILAQIVVDGVVPVGTAYYTHRKLRQSIASGEGSIGNDVPTDNEEPQGPKATQVYASELLDSNTCTSCANVDGRNYDTMQAALRDYPEGTYVNCEAGARCRGMLVVVWSEPGAGEATISVPSTIRAMRNRRMQTIVPKTPVEVPVSPYRRSAS